MDFAKIINKINSNSYSVVFGINISGMHVLPQEDQQKYDDFTIMMIERQMDIIYALNDLAQDCAFDLRYLFDPANPYKIRIYFLIKIIGFTKKEVMSRSISLGHYLLNFLSVNNNMHVFNFVINQSELNYMLSPFKFKSIIEIVRREDMIRLDAVKKRNRKIFGFEFSLSSQVAAEVDFIDTNTADQIYCVFPYSIHPENMERFCHVLFSQRHPCIVSICLQPYRLKEQDEYFMEERIKLCEKYSQLTLDGSGDIEKLEPFLKKRAETLYNLCSKEYLQLQDAAFLLKIQITSTHQIPNELIDILGVTITKHTGHPHLLLSDAIEKSFTGGYLCCEPRDKDNYKTALDNLTNMEFNSWISSVAPLQLQHWRYLFDVSEASSAFRLPIPGPAEFPGIDTIMYQFKPAPSDLPDKGLFLGEHRHLNRYRPVFIAPRDRRRHITRCIK